jgi:cysteine sulfinate desulfinase/cysteine desulfurase-like protein
MGLTEQQAHSSIRFSFGEPLPADALRFCAEACTTFASRYRGQLAGARVAQ